MWYSLLISWCAVSAMGVDIARMRGRAKRDQENIYDPSTVYVKPEECFDRTFDCEEESKNGFCESNSRYMEERCPWSCRLCKRIGSDNKQCNDQNKHCKRWQKQGDCLIRMDFMGQNCKRSCELCGSESKYFDEDVRCPKEAKNGNCKNNAQMALKCPHSCHKFRYLVYVQAEHHPQVSNSTNVNEGSQKNPEPTEESAVDSTYQHEMGPTDPPITSDYNDEEVRKALEVNQKDDRQHKLEVVLQKSKDNSFIAHPIYRTSSEPLVPYGLNGTTPVNTASLVPIRMATDPQQAAGAQASTSGSGNEVYESEETKEEKEDEGADAEGEGIVDKRAQANEEEEETLDKQTDDSEKPDKTKNEKQKKKALIHKLLRDKKIEK